MVLLIRLLRGESIETGLKLQGFVDVTRKERKSFTCRAVSVRTFADTRLIRAK